MPVPGFYVDHLIFTFSSYLIDTRFTHQTFSSVMPVPGFYVDHLIFAFISYLIDTKFTH